MLSLCLVTAAFLVACCRVCYKLSMRRFGEIPVLMLSQISGAAASLPLLILFFPQHAFDWHLLIIESALWTGFVYLEIRSYRYLDLGVAALMKSSEYLIQVLIGVTLFHEVFSGQRGLGVLFVAAGLTVSVDWRVPDFRRGALYQFGAAFCAIAALPLDAILVKQISPWFVAAFSFLGPAILLFIWRGKERKQILTVMRSSWLPLVSGLLNVAAYALLLYAFSRGGYLDSISRFKLTTLFSILLGWIVLGERGNVLRKLIACALLLCGTGFFA